MKLIPAEVISKLNLKHIGASIGKSILNSCTLYFLPGFIKGAKSLLMDCDLTGEPLEEGLLLIIIKTDSCLHKVFVTTDFVEMNDFKTLQRLVKPVLQHV
jgi:hypothetical protein